MNPFKPLVVSPATLEGPRVRLAPMTLAHLDELCAVGLDGELWRWIPTAATSRDDMRRYVETALQWEAAGSALPFVIVDRPSGKILGSTRLANIDKANRRLEIGWTWITPSWQRTHVNSEMKYLLLRHAFETLGCLRVELKTDALNEKSRRAILRIGATQEGIFRKHMICWDGRLRDTVYYSILDSEWPPVKQKLLAAL